MVGFGEGASTSLSEGHLRYSRAFPHGTGLRQLEVGHVLSGGPVARRIIGVTLTNEPFITPRHFAEAIVDPSVPAGWEYEVYQGDALVGVSSGDDPRELRAPLNYGNTPVRVRMIGPAGQERVEEILYVVPPGRLPGGDWRYSAGFGPCRDPGCESYGFGELRRGVADWLTAGVGVDRLDPAEGEAEARPWGYLGLTPATGVNLDLQSQPGAFFRGTLDWATPGSGTLGAVYAWTRPAGDAPTLDGWFGQLTGSLPLDLLGGRTLSGRVLARGRTRGTADSWQLFLATTLRRSYVSAAYESGLQTREIVSARVFTPLGQALHSRLRDLAVSGGLGATTRGPEFLEVGGSFRPVTQGSLTLDLRFRRGETPLLSLGFVARIPQGFVQARGARGSGAGLFLSADGGVAFGGEGGPAPLPFQSLGRSGVEGRVFYDLDGDGAMGQGDLPAPGVDVLVRGERVTTGEGGVYRSWEILPYEVAEVAVDSLSVDPSWVPAPRQILLRPSPNLFNRADLPLLRTREVVGRVEMGGKEPRPLGGVRVEIRDGEGKLVATPRTFSDGVFYVQRIPPGRYTVTVSSSSVEAVGGRSPPPLVLKVTGESDAPLELPVLRIEPATIS